MLTKNRIPDKHSQPTFPFFTFISHTLHFIDCLLAILLGKVFGFLHRLPQEFLKLGSDEKEMKEKV